MDFLKTCEEFVKYNNKSVEISTMKKFIPNNKISSVCI